MDTLPCQLRVHDSPRPVIRPGPEGLSCFPCDLTIRSVQERGVLVGLPKVIEEPINDGWVGISQSPGYYPTSPGRLKHVIEVRVVDTVIGNRIERK